jgi:HPr kinase/phosphorylase
MSRIAVHGTTVSLNGHAVLIRGAPGSGKSELALRMMDAPGCGPLGDLLTARLVADDQTELELVGQQVITRAPQTIKGLLEVRGLGIVKVPHEQEVPLILVVDLKPGGKIERMPEAAEMAVEILGKTVARCEIDANSPFAAAQVRTALLLAMGRIELS